jgi:hypothetical protein
MGVYRPMTFSNAVHSAQWEELQTDIGKSAGEWHFTLRGKTSVGTNELSPQGGNSNEL